MTTKIARLPSRIAKCKTLWMRAILLFLASALLTACTLTPRDGQSVTSMSQAFSGYHRFPSDRLFVQYWDHNLLKWNSVASLRSSSTAAYTDPCGYKWYPWSVNLTLPNLTIDGPYWFLMWTQHYMKARVVAGNGDILRSFEESSDADECMEEYECGPDILQNCGQADGEILLFCDGCSS